MINKPKAIPEFDLVLALKFDLVLALRSIMLA